MFKLQFETSNSAFGDDPTTEVVRILDGIADLVEEGYKNGLVADLNGNHVGWFSLTQEG